MGKILFIISQSDFDDKELSVIKEVIEETGYKTGTATIEKESCRGSSGFKIKPDLTVIEANKKIEYYDAVIVIGGRGSPKLSDYPEVFSILSRAKEKGKIIGGLDLGVTVLAKSGVLSGKQATTAPVDWAVTVLLDHYVKYMKKSVIVDGNFVTGEGPKAAEEFGMEIVETLKRT